MGRPWTEEEINRACAMRRQRMSYRKIGKALNRHHSAVALKLIEREFPRLKGNQRVMMPAGDPPAKPPTEREIERQALLAARALQDPISAMLGDPPPGWSALDRMGRCL